MRLLICAVGVWIVMLGNAGAAECPNCDKLANTVDCDAYLKKLASLPEAEYMDFAEANFFGQPIYSYTQKEEVFTAANTCLREVSIYLANNQYADEEALLAEKRLKAIKTAYGSSIEQIEKLEAEKVAMLQALEDETRLKDLKSGKVKVSSMSDVRLLHPERYDLFQLASRPLLQASKKIFQGGVRIDLQEGKLLRVKSEIMGISETYPRYVYLKITKKTVNFSPESMSIGGTISVIGKYIDNVQYRTVGGEVKTAPIIECLYLDRI